MNRDLSICIPTFNRSNRLRGLLELLLPQVAPLQIPIYISDNCSPDDTGKVTAEFQRLYPHLHYHRHAENIGPDRNFESVLKTADTRYRWLLSDDDRIVAGGVAKVLDICRSNEVDLVLLNGGGYMVDSTGTVRIQGRVQGVDSDLYSDRTKLLADLGWHMQFISCLVFSHDMIHGADFSRYRETFLVQFGAIFGYLATKEAKVYWLAEPVIYSDSTDPLPSWIKNTFLIFAKNWTELILGLPAVYSDRAKKLCIKNHGIKGRLFTFRSLIFLRANGILTREACHTYRAYLGMVSDVPVAIFFALSVVPVRFCRVFERLYGRLLVMCRRP